ncbi:MAG: ABC transporter, permease protein 2 (cluster 1, maltose/g3p/polyamine/iron) [uncultured Thermomicrobiales bacterium]|uniref:ABC transporter, permease protein 2 (Cluster 1, maltose/g3p/polyamine/iron) n=1 Tax=uncultured Thermomicrobiales bacterium TaxID=1645740 RepID=A0A6J4TRK5_9BACT|nr:MAG: ABC transporter, permease protein 2 (cluster 1, maltose/g3p/polyamine/iron) [uncultured Thermomicrobiales bacterium]
MSASTTPTIGPAAAAAATGADLDARPFAGASRAGRWRRTGERYLLWLFLGLGSVIMVGPFYWTLVTSFKERRELLAYPPTWWPEVFTGVHWRALNDLTVGSFPLFFRNSLFLTFTITAITLLTSSMAGYVFAKIEFRGRDRLFWVVLAMMMIPFTVTLIPSYALMADLGWINSYWALIVPIAVNPFGIFLMRQFMFSIPNDLIDASRVDGASEFHIFFKIVLPLSQAALGALAILTFMYQWDNFLWPLIILNDPEKYTLPLGLAQFRGRLGTDVGPTAAGAMISVIPVLVIYAFAQRKFIEGIAMTGLKG